MKPLQPTLPRLLFSAAALVLASCSGGHSSGDAGESDARAGDAGADTGAPDAGVADMGAESAQPDAGANDAGLADADASAGEGGGDAGGEDGASSDGSADAETDGAPSHGCDPNDPLATTLTCFTAQNRPSAPGELPASCVDCATMNGCFDPKQQGGTCEMVSGALMHLAGPIGDGGPTCATVIGMEPVSEKTICLQTLQMIFSSKCASSYQLTPCLCGSEDPTLCLPGQITPDGPLYDVYACDYNTTSGSTINTNFNTDFMVQTYGAGMANSIAECAGAYNCPCF